MARTKNRGLQQSFSPSYTVRRWRLGEYIRLSKEDLKKGKDDSNSVINQRDLLNDFYQKHIGEFESVSEYKQSLYQDWKDGEITQQDYRDMKADYERQTIALTDVLARLNAERAELANGVKSEHPALVAFTKHQNIDQLSRELLVELIDHIKVYENGNISVRFKFADEFRRIAEYIEINTTKPAVAG